MSNVLGTVVPIKDVVRIARSRGIPVFVDGAQAAVHMPVDVQSLDCDFYAFTGHKVYGPTGIGVLYAKKKHLDAMPPFLGGGEMIETVTTDNVTYGVTPHKFEAGTPPIVQAIGLGAALNYMMQIGRSGVAVRAGHHCAQPLMERLGVSATCRASFAMYNTRAEVDALVEALIKAHDFFA
jgi:cysteine desulfurase/selenocysteine lyase